MGFSRVLVMGVTFAPLCFLGAREGANDERPRFSPPRLWLEYQVILLEFLTFLGF